ncbi:MAG: hypothetical protein AAF415_10350 [Pseudomonadota bacterium]
MALNAFKRWLADGSRPAEDAVLVIAPDGEALRRIGPVLTALGDGRVRISVIFLTGDGVGATHRPPLPLDLLIQPTLTTLRARAALVVDQADLPGKMSRLAQGAIRRGVPVFGISSRGYIDPRPLSHVADADMRVQTSDALANLLIQSIGVERVPAWSLEKLASHLPRSSLLGGFATRLDSLDALRHRLGAPQTILCLGNGPTSAAPALEEIGQDALFRVNHDWRAKGFLTRPDMVFPGVKRAMRKLGRVPLGVATRRKEDALLACRLFEFWHGPTTYCVVEEVAASVLPAIEGAARPTTGAYMLATAVALAPERLVIAGIDMFSHPGGAYPGAGGVTNAYTPSHAFETDAAFIVHCLAQYEGMLEVFSPALLDLLRERVAAPKFTLTDRSQ